jgi:hypothetical protein
VIHPGLLSNPNRSLKICEELLAGMMGPYVRRVSITGSGAFVADVVAQLASRPRPWLYEIALDARGAQNPATEIVHRLVEASPRLTSIQLVGTAVIEPFDRVAVTTVETTDIAEPSVLVVAIPQSAPEQLGLAGVERLHARILKKLSNPAREAWAELRWLIGRGARDVRARGPYEFPVALFSRIVRELHVTSSSARDWIGLERSLPTATEARVSLR